MKIIDKRLNALLREIDCNTLVDVGCDHGKLSCQSLIDGKAKKVIAVDISDKSLQKCRDLAAKLKLENIDFRCSDGLSAIKDNEADEVVIAGMGGYEIIKILKRNLKGVNKYILCPHQDVVALREFMKHDYVIEKDYVLFNDDHFYSVIVASLGNGNMSKKEIYFGKDNLQNKDYIEYLKAQKEKYLKIMQNDIPDTREKECKDMLDMIEEELNERK